MKRVLIVIPLLLVILLSGCEYILPSPASSRVDSYGSEPLTDYSAEFSGKWSYRHLNSRLQSCYAAVYAAIMERSGADESICVRDSSTKTDREYNGLKVELPEPLLDKSEAQRLYTAFTWDNPQFFFVGNTYSYEGYRSGGTDYYNVFCLVFTMDAQERATAHQKLQTALADICRSLPENAGAFETELYLHDQLLSRCTYDTTAANSKEPAAEYPNAFTAYGALVEGRAVCEGYSRAMQLLLHRSNIECTLVSGYDKENKISHMWNLVTVDDRNYHLDATWNDSEDLIHHTFFNLTTEEMERTHTIDNENIGVDTCTAADANYYRRTGAFIEHNDLESIAAYIAGRIRKGDTTIDIRFPTEAYPNALYLIQRSSWLKQVVDQQLAGSKKKMWAYDYMSNDHYGTIVLFKKTF